MGSEPHEGSVRDLLAANLKAARARRQVSLSEVARLSGISKATLSQLESGTGNPTIETVFSLSRALGEPLSGLLEPPAPGGMTVIRAADVAPLVGEGVDLRPYGRVESAGLICELYDQQVRAGARQESPGHAGTEHTVVQSGLLRVEVDEVRVELGAGDYLSFDAVTPHVYTAPEGPVRSVLLINYRADGRGPAEAPH
ncbi:helix-turn-helix domain-containing protein [Streptomyces sp. NBC_01497]|uniref:helix-turn-helix domain-containing protein n=1 Tax=Streptomyces sp. NBC_01497 TaxID=2903885 RepID=UPI002E3703D3|nr:XRE family transcriptional regulator [Streptomyces sp. NBC_01497]